VLDRSRAQAHRAPGTQLVVGARSVGDAAVMLAETERKPPWECSIDGDDCSKTQCCSRPGSQCFVKNQYWSACNQTCDKGNMVGDEVGGSWTCDTIGPKAPPACSWEGENCMESGCCRRVGFKCFEKDDKWASCSDDCGKLSSLGDDPWTCKVLGTDLGVHVFQKSDHPAPTSLYCFTVVTPMGVVAPGVEAGYEQSLLKMMKAQKVGIFGCNKSDVFEGKRVSKGNWQSVVNTDIFLHVWNQVQAKADYKNYAWTVKVDADAMFLPDRLRAHLSSMAPPADTPVYLHNIKFKFHFMGALEVLSSKAVEVLLQSFPSCSKNLGHNGGEDFFTMQCLDASLVGHMTDFSLLNDKYTSGQGWNLFDVNPCTNQATVAFHPYKHVNSWQGCYKVAMGINKPTDFVGCDFRWHGDACSLNSQTQHAPGDVKPSSGLVR